MEQIRTTAAKGERGSATTRHPKGPLCSTCAWRRAGGGDTDVHTESPSATPAPVSGAPDFCQRGGSLAPEPTAPPWRLPQTHLLPSHHKDSAVGGGGADGTACHPACHPHVNTTDGDTALQALSKAGRKRRAGAPAAANLRAPTWWGRDFRQCQGNRRMLLASQGGR